VILLADLLRGASDAGARVAGLTLAQEFEGFAHDSRNVRGGEIFVAVRTERADGHDYLADAVRRGAAGILCERVPASAESVTQAATVVTVSDTRAALRSWAKYRLRQQAPFVIGVTGSVGKTCTTKAIAAVLRALEGDPRAVFENDNFNDLFGLPISLSRLAPAHQSAVLELATDSAGEIEQLCELVAPQWGVVTNVAAAHLEHFGTAERLAREYGALIGAASEHLILNRDDPRVAAMASAAAVPVTWFGVGEAEGLSAVDVQLEPLGSRFTLMWDGERAAVRLPLPGHHSIYTALAAAVVSLRRGHPLQDVARALEQLSPVPGRLNPLSGPRGTALLDDSFSATEPSALSACEALTRAASRRLAVVGAISGLQDSTRLGQALAGAAQAVVAVGDDGERLLDAARAAGLETGWVTHTPAEAAAHVRQWIEESPEPADAAVLVKGSEISRLERVVERLTDPTEHRQLVRQAPGAKQVVPLHLDRAAWMEVDLGAIAGNLQRLREIAAPAGVLAVLKADAYGHGAVRVARTAVQYGATMLGVAVLSEAAALRERGISAPILVLGYTPAWQARDALRLDVSVSVYSIDVARALARAAQALERPPARIHVKVDTGMHRLGLAPEEVVPFATEVSALPGIEIEGLFTHFASADDQDPSYALLQLNRFQQLLAEWERAGLPKPRYVHAANSAGTLRLPDARFDLVRTGIALYGMDPSPDVPCPEGFRPALALKTQLAQVKQIDVGEPVSYGCTWIAKRRSTIGVLPIGYADGFRRAPANWGEVLVRGRRAPLVGRVCMDMCMVDLTDVPGARAGDEVVLIGEQGGDRLSVEEVASRLGTINYEVVSQILARVPREIVSR
jgi:Alr-MurF fusion protein